MAIRITCESCGASLKGAEELAGKKVKCPKCGAVITAPSPTAEPEVPVLLEVRPPAPPEEPDSPLPAPPSETPSGPNIPAILSIPLALIAWPIVGLLSYLVFKERLPSLLVGMVVAVVAFGFAIWGIVLAMNPKTKSGGTGVSIAGVVMSGLSLIALVGFFIVLAVWPVKESSETPPVAKSPVPAPKTNVVKQAPAEKESGKLTMRCSTCGHEFEVSPRDYLTRQAAGPLGLLGEGESIDDILDRVEDQGDAGANYPCPQCGSRSGQVLVTCPSCNTRFTANSSDVLGGGALTCPHCGGKAPSPLKSVLPVNIMGN